MNRSFFRRHPFFRDLVLLVPFVAALVLAVIGVTIAKVGVALHAASETIMRSFPLEER